MKEKMCIDKDVIGNAMITDDAIAIYVALKAETSGGDNEYYISYNQLEYFLYNKEASRSQRISTVRGFEDLVNCGYINIIRNIGKSEYICDLSKINPVETPKNYVYISKIELRSIMNIKGSFVKSKLLRYYIGLIGTFRVTDGTDKFNLKIGVMPQSYLSYKCNVSLATINKYNKLLEKEKILYIVKNIGNYKNEDYREGFTILNNIYSRYEDKALCNLYCKDHGIEINNNNKINKVRSARQKINQMLKGCSYPIGTIIELHHSAIEINKELEKREEIMIANMGHEEELNYIDLSVFDPYMDEIDDELL